MALFNKFMDFKKSGSSNAELLSIVENLNSVLNTKKDYGSFLTDFGIRDMNEYTSLDDIVQAVMKEVKHNIEQFEPRVRVIDIKVMQDDNPFSLSFSVECLVRGNSRSLNMIFDSVFNNFHVENP